MILRKFIPKDAETIIKWIKDERAFRQWSADRYPNFPISADDINCFYHKFGENMHIFSVIDAFDNVIGHFTLRYPNNNDKTVLRLGFVIIDDKLRCKGVGKQMVSCAVDYAFNKLKADELTLGVFENNFDAYYCYKSCGFVETGLIEQYICSCETWNCIEMHILNN
ncbi:MAG: GNAT family N-acetyltransferase [Clostridia bacterium]|nr:GNAT family N-acetyltransferase [Clostridia bacterium]